VPPEYVLVARARFIAWLRWYMDTHPDVAPNSAALARKLGVTKPTTHYLLQKGSQRTPSFETLLAAERLLGFPVNVLLHNDPPSAPPSP
jgi:hypothetical protein